LILYCQRTKSSTIASRLGYLLERKQLLKDPAPLKKMITTYVKLDTSSENKKMNSSWKLYVGGALQ